MSGVGEKKIKRKKEKGEGEARLGLRLSRSYQRFEELSDAPGYCSSLLRPVSAAQGNRLPCPPPQGVDRALRARKTHSEVVIALQNSAKVREASLRASRTLEREGERGSGASGEKTYPRKTAISFVGKLNCTKKGPRCVLC